MATKRQRDKRREMDDDFAPPARSGGRGYKPPPELKAFKFDKAGTFKLNVYPYKAGKNNPKRDKGMLASNRAFKIHKDVGPDQKTICCPKMFDESAGCAICARSDKVWRETGDTKKSGAFRAQDRVVMVVEDLAHKDEGLQLLDSSYFKGVGEAIRAAQERDPEKWANWWDPKEGQTLVITTKKSPGGEGRQPWFEPVLADLVPRKKPLDKKLLASVPCLDNLFEKLSSDEVRKLFLGSGKPKDEDEEPDDEDETDAEDEEEDDDGESEDEDSDGGDEEEDEEGDESEEDDDDDESDTDGTLLEKDGEDDDEDEGEEAEEDELPQVGDKIRFKHKGKKKEGVVEKTAKKGKMLQVKVKGEKSLVALEADDETIKVLERAEEEDDEELDDDSEIEDDEESEDEEESDDDDDEDSDDEDDDDEDDEE